MLQVPPLPPAGEGGSLVAAAGRGREGDLYPCASALLGGSALRKKPRGRQAAPDVADLAPGRLRRFARSGSELRRDLPGAANPVEGEPAAEYIRKDSPRAAIALRLSPRLGSSFPTTQGPTGPGARRFSRSNGVIGTRARQMGQAVGGGEWPGVRKVRREPFVEGVRQEIPPAIADPGPFVPEFSLLGG